MVTHATGFRYLKEGALPQMWCPGCGAGIVLGTILRTFEELEYKNNETVVVTGIGCWGKADDYMVTNALHVTHGRALAYATGIKAFNAKLKVVVLMGDGDSVTIGGNHFIHAARRNIDLTAIIVNNYNYGMTGGQASSATPAWKYTSTTVYGNPEAEFDICELARAAGANYVARGTVYHGWDLQNNIKEALCRQGFSVVEVISPCPTHFGKNNNMKSGLDMFRSLKEHALPIEKYQRLPDKEKHKYFIIGKLTDRNAPDFNARYELIQAKAAGKGGI